MNIPSPASMSSEDRSIARSLVIRRSLPDRPWMPELSIESARAIGLELVEFSRLLIQQWKTALDTPQQLSSTIIRIKRLIEETHAEEQAPCPSETASAETSTPSVSETEAQRTTDDSSESPTSSGSSGLET